MHHPIVWVSFRINTGTGSIYPLGNGKGTKDKSKAIKKAKSYLRKNPNHTVELRLIDFNRDEVNTDWTEAYIEKLIVE